MPEPEGYPDEWATTLEDAISKVDFPILLPNDQLAERTNITAVYLYPDNGAVAIQFPPPGEPLRTVRQEYIEVWEAPWTGGDPLSNFELDLKESPAEGKAVYDLDGIPALGVTAHSPTDVDGSNPAFLRFVVNDVDVQVSGGESLDALIAIGRSIIATATDQ